MKKEFGQMPCRECGSTVKVMENENGGLSYQCLARGCDDNDYAKVGTLKNGSWRKKIVKFEPDATPAPEVKKPKEAKPAPEAEADQVKKKTDMWGNDID